MVYGGIRRNWAETAGRCRRLASALARAGVARGDVVAVLSPNTPPALEAHFGVPLLGAVLNAMNVRLDSDAIATILAHGEARVLIADREYSASRVRMPVVCEWKPAWDDLPPAQRATIKARQGVPYVIQEDLMVADPETAISVSGTSMAMPKSRTARRTSSSAAGRTSRPSRSSPCCIVIRRCWRRRWWRGRIRAGRDALRVRDTQA